MTTRLQMLIAMILFITLGLGAYSFLQISAATSRPIAATPITIDVGEAVLTDVDGDPALQTEAAIAESTLTLGIQADTGWPTNLAVESEIQVEVPGTVGGAGKEVIASPIIFEIAPAGSEAPLFNDEVFLDNPNTFIEATNHVTGQSDCDQS